MSFKRFIFLFIFLKLLSGGLGWKMFRLGRTDWGNLGAPAGTENSLTPPDQWFRQKLDHFTPTDGRTWKQRYFVNEQFYDRDNKKGPFFLMIGGEGIADPRWMVKGTWIDNAKKFSANCFMLEHRYYGKSHPTEDMSVKNLTYLSSKQALGDLANFIAHMNVLYDLDTDVKWIVFGGSYPGSLAAWMRLKYPHLVFAAVSSSGPLEAKMDFQDYYKVAIAALKEKTGNDDCKEALTQAHSQIVSFIKVEPNAIEKGFKVCKPFSEATPFDIKTFFNGVADDIAEVVQYNEDNRLNTDPRYKNITINSMCDVMLQEKYSPYAKLAAISNIMLKKSGQTCFDYSYENMINALRNTTWSADGGRQWFYQTCTEFGFYQTSSGEVDVFGDDFDLRYFVRQCIDVFGKKFNKQFIEGAVEATNNYYGGRNIAATRVVYVHGSVDPWHALGITVTVDDASPVVYIKGTAHCANMYPAAPSDLQALKAARVTIQKQLNAWIISA